MYFVFLLLERFCLQDKGYKTKMKTLEEILKLSQKMEAKLIGYDETPTDIDVSHANQVKDVNTTNLRSISQKVHSTSVNVFKSNSSVRRMVQPVPQCSSSNSSTNSNLQAPAGKIEWILVKCSFCYKSLFFSNGVCLRIKIFQVMLCANLLQNHICMKYVLSIVGNHRCMNVFKR